INKYGPGNYKDWVFGIMKGGYGARRTWSAQVIGINDKHKLYQLGENPLPRFNAAKTVKNTILPSSMQKYFLFSLVLIVCLSSCLPKNEISRRPPDSRNAPGKLPPPAKNLPRSSTAEAYIAQYKDIAIAEMNHYGIPASIKLAQALLESGNGNSSLARNANNHFGIKCTSSWQGGTVLKSDDNPDDCFRVYKKAEDSFRDHSEFLLRKRYAALFELNKNDYVGWARGLKKAEI